MLKDKSIYLWAIIVPMLILLGMSGYFATISWQKYQDNKKNTEILSNVNILQKLESATLSEALCMVLIENGSKDKSTLCKDKVDVTNNVLNEVKNSSNMEHWEREVVLIKKNILKSNLNNFEKLLSTKETDSIVNSYLKSIELKSPMEQEKELLALYRKLSDIAYATEIEKFLVTYYTSKNIPVPIENVIFWDKIIQSSYFVNVEDISSFSSMKEPLVKIANSDTLHEVLNKIDEMRITILTGKMELNNKKNLDWVTLLEKKQKSLEAMKSIIYEKLNREIETKISHNLQMLLLYILIFLLALLGLFTVYMQSKRAEKEKMALLTTANEIDAISSYDDIELEVMKKMLDEAKSKEDIYAYLQSSFQVLHEKEKQSKDEVRLKSQFLSTLSHEIRTPLNAIIGFSKLLKDMNTSEDQKEFLSLVENSSHKLIMIVNDILDLSKINADKMEIENSSFDIFDMVETTASSFTQQTDHKDIEFGLFIDPFLPQYVLGDEIKLSQILTNLIGNAVKFTEPYGKINIFVQSLKHNDSGVKIKFAVHDDGIGLTIDQTKNIFKAFSQATSATSNKYGGTGLGLTISHEMVELMGGELEVESKLNHGSTFFFTLDLKKDKEKSSKVYPTFPGVTIGLALPVKSIKRQLDSNLEAYVHHLGAKFKIYYYEDLFESYKIFDLPDIMIIDHHYARLAGELDQCASIDCKTVLLTNGSLYSRINPERHHFTDILYRPITLDKTLRILENSYEQDEVKIKPTKELENIESFKGLHALVADDNAINLKLIKIILEKIGLRVTMTSDGEEACEKYKEDRYDIIFMDIQMPIMDGIEATHCIMQYEREKKLPHVPIIALTANVGTQDKERYLSEGLDDYATKPLEIDRIKALISKYCER